MAYDRKYGVVTTERGNVMHGEGGVPLNESDEPVFVIRAQDASAVQAVRAYGECAGSVGASQETLEAVEQAADAIAVWQEAHPERVKVPD